MSENHIHLCDRCPRFTYSSNRPNGWSHIYLGQVGPFDLCESCTAELLVWAKIKLDHERKPRPSS